MLSFWLNALYKNIHAPVFGMSCKQFHLNNNNILPLGVYLKLPSETYTLYVCILFDFIHVFTHTQLQTYHILCLTKRRAKPIKINTHTVLTDSHGRSKESTFSNEYRKNTNFLSSDDKKNHSSLQTLNWRALFSANPNRLYKINNCLRPWKYKL